MDIYSDYENADYDEILVDKSEKEKNEELIKQLIKTMQNLVDANRNFEYADGELIDFYSYEIKAFRAKLNYLIRAAKQKGLELNISQKYNLRLEDEEVV